MSHPRHGRARGILVLGGAALVALGLWFGNFFQGPGLGGGGDDGIPGTSTSKTETDGDDGERKIVPLEPDDAKTNDGANDGDRTGPLHVVMVAEGYKIAIPQTDGTVRYEPATLDEIVTAAKEAEPSPDGHHVVITTGRRVEGGLHLDLVRKLEAAGFEPEQILGYEQRDVAEEEAE